MFPLFTLKHVNLLQSGPHEQSIGVNGTKMVTLSPGVNVTYFFAGNIT